MHRCNHRLLSRTRSNRKDREVRLDRLYSICLGIVSIVFLFQWELTHRCSSSVIFWTRFPRLGISSKTSSTCVVIPNIRGLVLQSNVSLDKLSSSLLPFFVYFRTYVIATPFVTQPSRRHISSLQISLLRPVQPRVPSYRQFKRYSNRHNTVFLARGSYFLFPAESQRPS